MKKLDLIGQKFHMLLVLERIPATKAPKRSRWKCLCDCGNTIEVEGRLIKSGNTKSCGCIKPQIAKDNLRSFLENSRQFHPSITTGRSIFSSRYSDGDLTFEDFYNLSQQNCFYCDEPPNNITNSCDKNATNYVKENCLFKYNGLDRINSNLPHLLNNCVTACKECNLSKSNMPLADYYLMIKNICETDHYKIYNTLNIITYNPKFNRIKSKLLAKYNDIDFSFEIFCYLISQNCFYCNREPSNKKKCKNGDIILTNGLDRIDQTRPHTLDNVVPCCKFCNWSKNNRSKQQFIDWAFRVYNNLKL